MKKKIIVIIKIYIYFYNKINFPRINKKIIDANINNGNYTSQTTLNIKYTKNENKNFYNKEILWWKVLMKEDASSYNNIIIFI